MLFKAKNLQGQAPGPLGWMGEMLLPLLESPIAMKYFTLFLSDLRNGSLPTVMKPYIPPASLLALEKPGSEKPRPVAVGELFYRIATSWSVQSSKVLENILFPVKLGIWVPGGVETACLLVQALLTDKHLGISGVATDISNAYNNRERKTMLKELNKYSQLKSIWRLADWSYTTPTPL